MGVEIERKFRVKSDHWRSSVVHRVPIQQGYLAGAEAMAAGFTQCSVRIRRAGESAWINVKSDTRGIARQEFEYPIPLADAVDMLALTHGLVSKIRHHVPVGEVVFEVDEFLGDNEGLVLAEIELPTEAAHFPIPAWLGREVSEEGRYYNINLITRPFNTWPSHDQKAVS